MRSIVAVVAALTCVWTTATTRAEVRLPALLADDMVLQRDMPVRIWGWAASGEKVTVAMAGESAATAAGKDGRWEVRLPAMKAGGPHELIVSGTNRIVRKNVLVGEVWFCAGQSNMNWPVFKAHNHEKALADADHPRIRLLTVPEKLSKEPQTDIDASWRVCSRQTVSWFSAVGYFFGLELHRELNVPVGLVMAAVNGTRIEPWTPAVGVRAIKELAGVDAPVDGDIYNGMVHPVTPMTIRGVIWYQGEGNVGDSSTRYFHRMQALIGGYRAAWAQPDMPFYYVQIAPLNWGGKPVDVHPLVWESQLSALSIRNTGMAVTTDIGNIGDAHPRNKVEVGRRLSLWALAKTYDKKDLPHSGPLFREMKIEGSKVRLSFDYSEGLASRDGKPLSWFTIAGGDGTFHAAQAEIDGETILVSAEAVKAPKAVRFGWHQVAQPNLVNRHGLPASPFRTDAETRR